IVLGPALEAFRVAAGESVASASPDPRDQSERASVSLMRDYRKGNLRIVRGDFHRHSEISMDGGNDGTLLDQWRYAIDTGALDWIGWWRSQNAGGGGVTS